MAALDESRSGRSPSMAEHSTVHIQRTFPPLCWEEACVPLLLPVSTSHARGKGRKVGQGQMERTRGEVGFGSWAGVLFVCFLAVGLVSLLRVKGKSVSEAAEWGGERSGKTSMTKSAH